MIYRYNIGDSELDNWISIGKIFQLIDISEENMMKNLLILSQWIPASKLLNSVDEINNEIPVVLCCQTGENSFFLMNILHIQYNKTNIYSLKSGIDGWENKKLKLN